MESNKLEDITKEINFIENNYIDNISFSYIDDSTIHGKGLFASQKISEGTILGFLDGQFMSWDQWEKIRDNIKSSMGKYEKYILMEYNQIDPNTLLVRPFRTKYSLINHSKNPNVKILKNPHRIVAIKNINKDDEYTIDYNEEPMKAGKTESDKKDYLK